MVSGSQTTGDLMSTLKPRATPILVALVTLGAWTAALPQDSSGLATVTLADSSSIPLRDWELSYEYAVASKKTPQFTLQTRTRSAPELWVKKKAYPVAGRTLSILYDRPKRGASVVKRLLLSGGQEKDKKLKPNPPHRKLLSPESNKKLEVTPRSLDLKGETVTGTKLSFCLVSYTPQVECPAAKDKQVRKIVFE
jgi:hypothetical protein